MESHGEVSGVVDSGNMHTFDNDDNTDLATSADPDEQACNFSQKSWREDLELVVEGRTLHVASNILSLLSPVFTTMFEECFQGDGPRRIQLTGKKHSDVVQFIRCLYPNIRQQITKDNVFVVLPLADEFKVKHLKEHCEEFLVQTSESPLSNECVLKYLQLASSYDLRILRAKCIKLAASINPRALLEAERETPLPPDIKIEVQGMQNRELRKNVSKLRSIRKENEGYRLLMKEFLIYNLAIRKGKEKFRHVREGALKLTISNACAFQSASSCKTTIHGIVWHCFAMKRTVKDKDDQLSVYLKSEAPADWNDWKCEVFAEMWLLNNETGKHLIRESTHTFIQAEDDWGYAHFTSMKDLTSGGNYTVDGDAQVNVYFLVNKPILKPNPKESADATDEEVDDNDDEDEGADSSEEDI